MEELIQKYLNHNYFVYRDIILDIEYKEKKFVSHLVNDLNKIFGLNKNYKTKFSVKNWCYANGITDETYCLSLKDKLKSIRITSEYLREAATNSVNTLWLVNLLRKEIKNREFNRLLAKQKSFFDINALVGKYGYELRPINTYAGANSTHMYFIKKINISDLLILENNITNELTNN